MKLFVPMAVSAFILVGCAQQESSDVSTATPAVETNASPATGVGASATASSGIGTATASGSAAVESDAAKIEQQNSAAAAPAGTGAQNPAVNSNGVGNAGSSTPQNSGSNR